MTGRKLLIIGDSISLGVTEVFRSEVISRLPLAYPDLLRDLLPGWDVVIDAAVNRTTTQALPLVPALLQLHRPDAVLLFLGGNDGDIDWRRFIMTQGESKRCNTPLERFQSNLEQLVSLVRGAGSAPLLADIPRCLVASRAAWMSEKVKQDVNAMVERAGGQPEARRSIGQYNAAIDALAAHQDVAVVRWADDVLALPPDRGFGPDATHPAADAQPIIAAAVARELANLPARTAAHNTALSA